MPTMRDEIFFAPPRTPPASSSDRRCACGHHALEHSKMVRERGIIPALKVVLFACSCFAAVFIVILMIGRIVEFVQSYKTPLARLKEKSKKKAT